MMSLADRHKGGAVCFVNIAKKREATVKYVEVINGVKTEHNLCTQCAAHADLGQFSALFEGEFPLGKLLSGLLGTQETEEEDESTPVLCARPAERLMRNL